MSCPAAPWMCTSKNAGDRMPSGKLWMFALEAFPKPSVPQWLRFGRLQPRSLGHPAGPVRPTVLLPCTRFAWGELLQARRGTVLQAPPACGSIHLPPISAQAKPYLLGWCGMKTRVALTVSLFFLALDSVHLSAQSIDLPTSKQLIGGDSRPSPAPEQPAHFDGRLSGQALRGYGQCRLWHFRVEIRPVSGGSRYADRARWRIFLTTARSAERQNRRFIPAWPSAPTEPAFYASMGSVADPTGEKQGDTATASSCTNSQSGK